MPASLDANCQRNPTGKRGVNSFFMDLFNLTRKLILVIAMTYTTKLPADNTLLTPKVLVILLDGIPADSLEATSTPNIDRITAKGRYMRAYVGGDPGTESESPTISAVGYQSMLTGTWANIHHVYDNNVDSPNYEAWDFFRIAKTQRPDLSTAIYSTWEDNRTKLIGDGLDAAGGHKIDYAVDGLEHMQDQFPHDKAANYIKAIDAEVTARAIAHLGSVGPDLSWLYLQYTDDVGHRYGDSPEMTSAIKLMDDLMGDVSAAISERQENHPEDWLILITTDHGRDALTGKDHGGQTIRERTTWIATNHPNVIAEAEETPAIVDLLPTLLDHLNIHPPQPIADQLAGRSLLKAAPP